MRFTATDPERAVQPFRFETVLRRVAISQSAHSQVNQPGTTATGWEKSGGAKWRCGSAQEAVDPYGELVGLNRVLHRPDAPAGSPAGGQTGSHRHVTKPVWEVSRITDVRVAERTEVP